MIKKQVYISLVIGLIVFAFANVISWSIDYVSEKPVTMHEVLIDEGGEQGEELSTDSSEIDIVNDVYDDEYEMEMKSEKVNDATLTELLRNSTHLEGDWYYVYKDYNKETYPYCGFQNLLLINKEKKEIVYAFDRDFDYGGMSCLGKYFKFDKENQVLYFIRSYEFCMGTYYSFDLKTLKLSEMQEQSKKKVTSEGVIDFNIEEAAQDECFIPYFKNFKLFPIEKKIVLESAEDKKLKSRFIATEIVSSNLPESIEFWTQADCPWVSRWEYDISQPGYYVVNCTNGEEGSHGGCDRCIMSKIELKKGNYQSSSNMLFNSDYGLYYPDALNEEKRRIYSTKEVDDSFEINYSISLDYLTETQRKNLSSVNLAIIIDNEIPCSVDGLKSSLKYVVHSSQVGIAYIGDYYFEKIGGCDTAMHTTYCTDTYIGKVKNGNCAIVRKSRVSHSCYAYGEGECEYVEYNDSKAGLDLYDIFASIRFVK